MNNSASVHKNAVTIYHNPRCSKSRQTLALIENAGIEPEIIYYLDNPPSDVKLQQLLDLLGMTARQLMRKGESVYKSLNLKDEGLSEAELISAMRIQPILIERPIVECANGACIGRPPESVMGLINQSIPRLS